MDIMEALRRRLSSFAPASRSRSSESERGQTIIEFALIATALLMLSAGLIDVGRAFFQYNAVSAAAVYGARWGSAAGGTCADPYSMSNNDFCNQLSHASGSNFWNQQGNYPLQGVNTPCPSYSSAPSDYYTVGNYNQSYGSTIVGAIAQRFDSNNSSPNFIIGALTPGIDSSKLKVCIAVTNGLGGTAQIPTVGDTVSVSVYAPFYPVSALLTSQTLLLNASSQYQVE